ncbi:MAG: hypothetical protein ACE5J0_03250 [Candidatus Paceibacterales bacterium]
MRKKINLFNGFRTILGSLKDKNQLFPLTLGVLIFSFLLVIFILAWTEPSQAPPGANVAAPAQFSPDTPQIDNVSLPFSPSIWIKNTGGDDFLRFQDALDAVQLVVGNNGNVGIGTVSPQQKLDVVGNINATNFIGGGSQITGISLSCYNQVTQVYAYDTVYCAAGYTATGGGCKCTNAAAGDRIFRSAPVGNGWFCNCNTNTWITVEVRCCKIN